MTQIPLIEVNAPCPKCGESGGLGYTGPPNFDWAVFDCSLCNARFDEQDLTPQQWNELLNARESK